MKKKIVVLSFISLLSLTAASGLFTNNFVAVKADEDAEPAVLPTGSHTINVLNVQDYIDMGVIEGVIEDGEYIFDGFQREMNEKYGVNDIKVIYSTTDTPETMFNEVKITPGGYDLICPSDYMIQKLISENMITKLDFDLLPNYNEYVSRYIRENQLDPIEATNKVTKTIEKVGDYAVGYMWGTLGIVFDPTYAGRDPNKFISDMQYWDVMWNPDYQGIGTIKDSVRDTYAIGLLHAYEDDYDEGNGLQEGFKTLREKYDSGEYDQETYHQKFSDLFNRCDQTAIDKVRTSLNSLLGNVFGLEVDQGKQDIVEGKIGINFAWSGDAVYSLDLAEGKEKNAKELCYTIPNTGSNVWFDAWVMPKYDDRDACKTLLAHEFLDYLSRPDVAAMNMNETGYTSFIGGDDILELVRDWYDIRTELIYNLIIDEETGEEDYNSLFYYSVDEDTGEEIINEVWFNDVHYQEDSDPLFDDVELYYGHATYDEETGDIIEVSDIKPLDEKYNERLTFENLVILEVIESMDDLETVDLIYFFDGTVGEDYSEEDMIFYTDCYLPYTNEDGSSNTCVGRQFFTQYPDFETLTRCAVMRDFGPQNDAVMNMWENFRSTSLPSWAIILFIVEIALILFAVGVYFYAKFRRKSFRKKRNQ